MVLSYIEFEDQTKISADSTTVFKTLLDVNSWGKWWKGHPAKIRGDEKLAKEGSIVDAKIQGYIPITLSMTARITEIVTDQSIKEEWFEGDLVGTGDWTIKPVNGRTLVRFHMKVRPNRFLVTLLSKFMSPKQVFIKIMRSAFTGLHSYVKQP